MQGMVRWGRAVGSLLVLVGVMTSSWATCLEADTSSATQQMACCKAGHHDCPMKDSASDCCKTSAPHIESEGTVAKVAPLDSPVAVAMVWLLASVVSLALPLQREVAYHSPPPDFLHAPPAYLAFSGLLI
jgi:hypothetical protein